MLKLVMFGCLSLVSLVFFFFFPLVLYLIQSFYPFKGNFFLIIMGSSSWTIVNGRLVRVSDQRDMDSRLISLFRNVQSVRCMTISFTYHLQSYMY